MPALQSGDAFYAFHRIALSLTGTLQSFILRLISIDENAQFSFVESRSARKHTAHMCSD